MQPICRVMESNCLQISLKNSTHNYSHYLVLQLLCRFFDNAGGSHSCEEGFWVPVRDKVVCEVGSAAADVLLPGDEIVQVRISQLHQVGNSGLD